MCKLSMSIISIVLTLMTTCVQWSTTRRAVSIVASRRVNYSKSHRQRRKYQSKRHPPKTPLQKQPLRRSSRTRSHGSPSASGRDRNGPRSSPTRTALAGRAELEFYPLPFSNFDYETSAHHIARSWRQMLKTRKAGLVYDGMLNIEQTELAEAAAMEGVSKCMGCFVAT